MRGGCKKLSYVLVMSLSVLVPLLFSVSAPVTAANPVKARFLVSEKQINGYMIDSISYLELDDLMDSFELELERYGNRTFALRFSSRSCRLFAGQNAVILNGKLIRFQFNPLIIDERTAEVAIAAEILEKLLNNPVSLLARESGFSSQPFFPPASTMDDVFIQSEDDRPKLVMSFDTLPVYDVRGGDPSAVLTFIFSNTTGTPFFGKEFEDLVIPFESIEVAGEGMTTEVTVSLSHPMRWFEEAFGEVGKLEISLFTPEAITPLVFEETAEIVETGEAYVPVLKASAPVILPVFGQVAQEEESVDSPLETFTATGELTMLFESILMGATVEGGAETGALTVDSRMKTDLNISEWLDLLPDGSITVVLDPGHGGEDHGCRSVHNNLVEKDLNLVYARRIQKLFAGSRVRVILTRDGDFSLSSEQRKDTANRAGADMFVSLHTDSVLNESLRGLHVFYYSGINDLHEEKRPEARPLQSRPRTETLLPEDLGIDQPVRTESVARRSEHLARVLFDGLKEKLGWPGLGVKGQRLLSLDGLLMPGIVVELGFLSSTEDVAALRRDDVRTDVAEGVLVAIVRYLSGRY